MPEVHCLIVVGRSEEKGEKGMRFLICVLVTVVLVGCSYPNGNSATSDDIQAGQSVAEWPKRPAPSRVALTAARVGVRFQFSIAKRTFRTKEPIIVTVRAINPTDRDVSLKPKSTYPSLFDFEIWDGGKMLQYSVNMAMNPGDKTVLIPAKSSVVWTKEDVAACTMAFGGGKSSLRKPGKHRLSFGTGDAFDLTVTTKDTAQQRAPTDAAKPRR